MKALFDLGRPHFAAWIGLYDIDAESGGKLPSEIASPLYYSALCGFHDLVRHLAIKYPQHINAIGGTYGFPLVAALCRNRVPVAELLLEHGGSVDVQDTRKQTALHKTVDRHDKLAIGAVQFLLERGADVNARRDDLWTPLHLAVNTGELLVAQMLLDHRADVNSRNSVGQTPLHLLSRRQTSQDEDICSDIAELLLARGANVNEKDKDNATPLHLASCNKRLDIVRVLLNHGANADAENDKGETPLQIVLRDNHNTQDDGVGIVQLLLEHGAEAYARDKYRYDAILLHSASYHGRPEMVRMLLNHGVKSNAKNRRGETALHVVSRGRYDSKDGVRVAMLLLERGIDVNAQNNDRDSPLHSASFNGKIGIARVLLDHDAKVSAKNNRGETPLHQVSQGEYESQVDGVGIAQLLLDRGVDVNAQDGNGATALHLASWSGKLEVARLFLEQATLKNDSVLTPLHVSSKGEYYSKNITPVLLTLVLVHPVDLNAQQKDLKTPLHFACFRGKPEIARLLLNHGGKADARNNQGDVETRLIQVTCLVGYD
ncbi:ankyrin repeat-containing domain protein [Lactarius akahatsu]|uniref:Ankyrin repeat-containing domain protein n=1 Tax=Lactarius akahatsu TaxID=416441 RepID=A0AAD4Q8G2_9AGAM|nr:ankyrin repeat-containing domain protein [Lactarius akahatsu]